MARREYSRPTLRERPAWACPYCGSADACKHFIGWTLDGRTIELRDGDGNAALLHTDLVVNTGFSHRVYRHPYYGAADGPAPGDTQEAPHVGD